MRNKAGTFCMCCNKIKLVLYVTLMMRFLNFQDCEIPNPRSHCLKSFLGSQSSYFREKRGMFKPTKNISQTFYGILKGI